MDRTEPREQPQPTEERRRSVGKWVEEWSRAIRRLPLPERPDWKRPNRDSDGRYRVLLFCDPKPLAAGQCSAQGVPHIHTEHGAFMIALEGEEPTR